MSIACARLACKGWSSPMQYGYLAWRSHLSEVNADATHSCCHAGPWLTCQASCLGSNDISWAVECNISSVCSRACACRRKEMERPVCSSASDGQKWDQNYSLGWHSELQASQISKCRDDHLMSKRLAAAVWGWQTADQVSMGGVHHGGLELLAMIKAYAWCISCLHAEPAQSRCTWSTGHTGLYAQPQSRVAITDTVLKCGTGAT